MATVSDGSTDVSIGNANETFLPILEKSSKTTGGGNIRSITGGERIKGDIKCRLSPATYRSLIDLLNNGAANYFYTPNATGDWTNLYPATTWPLNCNYTNLEREWDNRSYFYVNFTIESTSYV